MPWEVGLRVKTERFLGYAICTLKRLQCFLAQWLQHSICNRVAMGSSLSISNLTQLSQVL